MVTIRLLVLSLLSLYAYGLPGQTILSDRNIPITRNTIFSDERLEGEVFENIDAFNNTELALARNVISPYRLPTTTKPTHYRIHWTIDLDRAVPRHDGTVEIDLHATQANISEIVIHSDELSLSDIILRQGDNEIPIYYYEDKPYQFLRIFLVNGVLQYNDVNPVIYTLSISFGADLRTNMYGIYLNWFTNPPDTTIRYMASTQFQATAARWAFPCYDEPSFKAYFDVTITRHTNYGSWFCTRRREFYPTPGLTGYISDVYHTTPKMSTYLLALIVADYGNIPVTNDDGELVHEVIARRGAIDADQGVYADRAGRDLLKNMSAHTDYDFYDQHPQLKMTQAAIPDFGAGAMENWGLLTYREAYLMSTPGETNSNFQQLIAYILSHEIAHMWFGNLVTCDWWDVLWLNEGFARYYQYFLTYWVEDMGFATRFVPEQVHTALLSDSSNNPQPLTNPGVATNAQVSSMFGTISYNKGAAVIRMTEHFLGFYVHEQGLRYYLRDKDFTTAVPLDLFQNLERAGLEAGALNYGPDFSFIDYYKSWTEQPGHPVLDVHVNHQTGIMTVIQRRFNINTGYSSIGNNYIVPITFTTASQLNFEDTKPKHVISNSVSFINRDSVGDEWVIFNIQQTGFYRVNYDEYTWNLIVLALRNPTTRSQIHELNKAQIVNDVFQFARSGLMKYNRALNILSFLEGETDYAPWVTAITGFNWLRNRLAARGYERQLEQLDTRIGNWASNLMNDLTYETISGEPFLRSYLRWQLAPLMCNLVTTHGDACRQAAVNQFNAMFVPVVPPATNTPVSPDNRNWVYCNALRQDTSRTSFDYLWNRFQESNLYTEKILILQNIGCARDLQALTLLMNSIFLPNNLIRRQDYNTAFSTVVNGNEENTQIAFTYIQENLETVTIAYDNSSATPLSYITARLRSEDEVDAFILWANRNRGALGTAYNSAINGAESTRQGIRWVATVEEDLSDYLGGTPAPISTTTPTPPTAAPATTTTQRPPISEPSIPNLPSPSPDSAASTFLAMAAIVLAVMANIIL